VYLPRADGGDHRMRSDSETPEPPRGKGETILVVEDEQDVRILTEEILLALGYNVLTAKDGHEGLKILKTRPGIDALLTDVVLPGGLSGPDLAHKASQLQGDLKILFMSGLCRDFGTPPQPPPRRRQFYRQAVPSSRTGNVHS
jgi:PleD family two-component response regulator